MEKSLNYSDIFLVPQYSELRSRSEADISVEFLGKKYLSPVLPANMKSVIDINIAKWLSENDYFYIYHRFGDTKKFLSETIKYTEIENGLDCKVWKTISISVGVKEEDKKLIRWIAGVDDNEKIIVYPRHITHITIDIAYANSILAKEMIQYIRHIFNLVGMGYVKIIAGNVCTPEGVENLENWGVDAIKVGVGGGKSCVTKDKTAFHIPMFSCLLSCCETAHVPIIADGGIRDNGDIVKSLAAGSTLTMIGSLFCACKDSPAENIYDNAWKRHIKIGPPMPKESIQSLMEQYGNITHKKYFGSASAKNKGANVNIEGIEIDLPCNGLTYAEKYQEIKESLQSAVSYAGGTSIKDLHNVEWITTK